MRTEELVGSIVLDGVWPVFSVTCIFVTFIVCIAAIFAHAKKASEVRLTRIIAGNRIYMRVGKHLIDVIDILRQDGWVAIEDGEVVIDRNGDKIK
jgi:hypothetical protein